MSKKYSHTLNIDNQDGDEAIVTCVFFSDDDEISTHIISSTSPLYEEDLEHIHEWLQGDRPLWHEIKGPEIGRKVWAHG